MMLIPIKLIVAPIMSHRVGRSFSTIHVDSERRPNLAGLNPSDFVANGDDQSRMEIIFEFPEMDAPVVIPESGNAA
jgi:hypothetical protein